jgi:hypothetical protein
MPRQIVDTGKHHRPGYVGRSAPLFGPDEIGDATEQDSDGSRRRANVADGEDRDLGLPRHIPDRQACRDQSAVKRHAAVPQFENLERMRGIIRPLVEDHLPQPAADDDGERGIKYEIADRIGIGPRR